MEKSESIKSIGKALGVFHTKVAKIPKTDENPFFKSKYAGLPSILEAIQKPLEESGLCFTQMPDGDGLTTLLIHSESGEFLQSTYKMIPTKTDPQSLGSAITYARRYALGAILGLNIDTDDDGNNASQPSKQQPQATGQSKQGEKPTVWLNLFNKDGSVNETVKAGLEKHFSEGKTLDAVTGSRIVKKDELAYITENLIK